MADGRIARLERDDPARAQHERCRIGDHRHEPHTVIAASTRNWLEPGDGIASWGVHTRCACGVHGSPLEIPDGDPEHTRAIMRLHWGPWSIKALHDSGSIEGVVAGSWRCLSGYHTWETGNLFGYDQGSHTLVRRPARWCLTCGVREFTGDQAGLPPGPLGSVAYANLDDPTPRGRPPDTITESIRRLMRQLARREENDLRQHYGLPPLPPEDTADDA